MDGWNRRDIGLVATAAALVFSRVFGLSLVLPNFRSHYEATFAVDAVWIGLAFGAYGLTMALATNNNAVSSPTTSPTMMMNMACHLFGLTTEEALAGFTSASARALGVDGDRGTLEVGKRADLSIWRVKKPGELAYRVADNPCAAVVKNGTVIFEAPAIEIAGRAW